MNQKEIKTGCGDWHLGWGFGGSDHVGELSTIDKINFVWTGKRQGRHGQKIRGTYKVHFTLDEFRTRTVKEHGLPDRNEVAKAIQALGVDPDLNDVGDYIQANEDAYFDNFCQENNI